MATAQTNTLPTAKAGDLIDKQGLAQTHARLLELSNSLNEPIAKATDLATANELGQLQNSLNSLASDLTVQSITLLTGEAKISAEHINAASKAAKSVIDEIVDIKARIAKIGAVISFVGIVLTGSGTAILKAAHTLKDALEKPANT